MMDLQEISKLAQPAESKVLLFVLDGLGGLPAGEKSQTALEAAKTPHMDQLARQAMCGLHVPVAPGITPGSGPAHLALFGYDPILYQVGRGVLSALGIDFELEEGDVAARGNFCTLDEHGNVSDRRAGRISTKKNEELVARLQKIEVEGVEIILRTVKEHRLLLVLRGQELSGQIHATDPQETGVPPHKPQPLADQAARTANKVRAFLQQARQILSDQKAANMVLLRGFAQKPQWPLFPEIYGVRASAIAAYPMYRGVAKLVGMQAELGATSFEEELQMLEAQWEEHDFFFLHFKSIDSYGEDGNLTYKTSGIEYIDTLLPRIQALQPDVILLTGDHSTPVVMRSHSWHPVPVLLWSKFARPDAVTAFNESSCLAGALGRNLPAKHLMPLAMAHASRLQKFGA